MESSGMIGCERTTYTNPLLPAVPPPRAQGRCAAMAAAGQGPQCTRGAGDRVHRGAFACL